MWREDGEIEREGSSRQHQTYVFHLQKRDSCKAFDLNNGNENRRYLKLHNHHIALAQDSGMCAREHLADVFQGLRARRHSREHMEPGASVASGFIAPPARARAAPST